MKTRCLNSNYESIVNELIEHELSRKQLSRMILKGGNSSSINKVLVTIGNYYPIYEPRYGYYKILTDRDIEVYREEIRRRR